MMGDWSEKASNAHYTTEITENTCCQFLMSRFISLVFPLSNSIQKRSVLDCFLNLNFSIPDGRKLHGALCNAQEMALLQRLTYFVCFDDVVIILILMHGNGQHS